MTETQAPIGPADNDPTSSGSARFVAPDALGDEEVPWDPVVIPCAAIDAEIERLADEDTDSCGQRRSLVLHPNSTGPGWGFAPGIQVALEVLRPGEVTPAVRHNSSQVVFCIRGGGSVQVDGLTRPFGRHDAWNTPSMATYRHVNDGEDLQVRLVYSNAALLKMMRVHYIDIDPPAPTTRGDEAAREPTAMVGDAAPLSETDELFTISDEGAQLMTYERLVNPPVQHSPSLLWRWDQVKAHLDKLAALGQEYKGRRLYLLYNPATGRTNGTTHNFFATITMRPAGIVDRPHRHTAAAINYYFAGHGWSQVGGRRYEWAAGDLMLSAPGWAIHNHASGDEPVYELTVQDSPLNLAMDSLLWQEDLEQPPALIGSHTGFATNRHLPTVQTPDTAP